MNCLKGEIIKEMEAKAKKAIDQKEYTMGNVLVNAEQLLSLIYEVKVKRYHNHIKPGGKKCTQ